MSETLRYNGQTVVVTGASRGIGRELARLFASRGACVVVNGRTRETVDKQVAEIVSAGGTATGNVGDVSVSSNAKALIEQALDHYGRIDAVINNAGILGFSPIESMSVEDFDAVFNVNLRGAFNVTQAAWPTMKKTCYGRVIFLPSHAIFGAADSSHYALSKGALFGLMRALTQLTSFGNLKHADDEAIVITATPGGAAYFSLVLHDFTQAALDSRAGIISMNHAQAERSQDGSITFVVSVNDPGVHNWVNPMGWNATYAVIRWQGLPRGTMTNPPAVNCKLVKLKDLKSEVPSSTRWISADERREQIARHQRQYQLRFSEK